MPVRPSLASWTAQLWQCRASLPSRAAASISLDRCPQPAERLTQIFVFYIRQSLGDFRCQKRIGSGRFRPLAVLEGGLAQGDAADRLPAEKPVYPLQNHGREVLDFECRGAFDPRHKSGGFPGVAGDRAGPVELERFAMGGDLGADNVGPARNDLA